jgi:hypothetical protein
LPPLFCHEEETLKTIELKILGSDREPVDIVITPEVTPQDILTQLGLANCCLSRQGEQYYFHPEEAIYDTLEDGDKLYAITVCTIGHCAG